MTKKLHISDDLSLPPDTVTSTLVVYGGKGMGKTNFGSVLVEELNKAGLRWCALDPLGVWWGLRHSKDGKGPGIECVILGGAHGDIPIEPTGGAVAADLVVDEPSNVIIDFSRKPNGDMWSIGEKVRFVTEYALRLFQRQGGLTDGRRREPIFQILDEAARYIPQIIPSGSIDLAKCVGAWETLTEEGRNIGIGIGLLTQRSARMNKSVSEVADAMISFRIVGPNSIGAVMDWMGEHVAKEKIKAHIETLRKLPRGTCLIVSPGWLQFEDIVQIRERETFDSSATPKPGERPKRVTGEAAKPDLAKYAERMKETIERVKADDPKELRRTIAELRKQAASHKPVAPKEASRADPQHTRQVKQLRAVIGEAMKVIAKVNAIGFDGSVVNVDEIKGALERAANEIVRLATQKIEARHKEFERTKVEVNRLLAKLQQHISEEELSVAVDVTKNEPVSVRPAQRPPLFRREVIATNGDLTGPEQRILNAIAWLNAIGVDTPEQTAVAFLAGYTIGGGAWGNPRGKLKSRGFVEYLPGDRIRLTEEGRSHAQSPDAPLDAEELQRRVLERLPGPESKILSVLLNNREGLPNEELAEKAGYAVGGGAYGNPRGRLRSLGLIEYRSGLVVPKPLLFLESA